MTHEPDDTFAYMVDHKAVLQGDLPEVQRNHPRASEPPLAGPQLAPLEARGLPFAIHDPRKLISTLQVADSNSA